MMKKRQLIACLLVMFVSSSHQEDCACNPWAPYGQPGTGCDRTMDSQHIQQCQPNAQTGVYTIYPKGMNGIRVRCDMDTAGGGWTFIQRRISDSDFYKTWAEYQTGFGDLNANFWLGNYLIYRITSQSWYELRIDMTGPSGDERYAEYDLFAVADGFNKYQLLVGSYTGTAGDSLTRHNEQAFSTKDEDNDNWKNSCAVSFQGAWWYTACHGSNLNGLYGNDSFGQGMNWKAFTGHRSSLTVDMKIRRHP